jgi:hypothetical protein
VKASDITPKPIDWLWHPYLPLGKLTLLAGQMGQAKSLLTVWLAAAVTHGAGLELDAPGKVLMLNAEDDPEDTIRPRLEAAGADLENVWVEPHVHLDVDHLGRLCESGDVRLITVDPISAYLPGNVNSWKGQDVRAALEPLRKLAAQHKVAVVLVQHLNRRSDTGDALARIADSQAVAQLARSVLVWGADPADPEGDQGKAKVLARAKGNLARSTASASFEIAEHVTASGIKAPALTRHADREVRADDLVADSETRTAADEAEAWLRDILADGPVPAREATKQAREVGIADRTLKRAKRAAGVVSESSRDDNGITGWTWSLEPVKKDGPLGTIGPLGTLGKTQGAKDANGAKADVGVAGWDDDALQALVDQEKAAA